jgi:hypothetical protein
MILDFHKPVYGSFDRRRGYLISFLHGEPSKSRWACVGPGYTHPLSAVRKVRFGSFPAHRGDGRECLISLKADVQGGVAECLGFAISGHCIRPLAKHPL